MYKQNKMQSNKLEGITPTEGECIEEKLRRILNNKEPIRDTVPLIYTERADGVKPEHDIRTDRFDLALDGMDVHYRTGMAKREERSSLGKIAAENMNVEAKNQSQGDNSTSATDSK